MTTERSACREALCEEAQAALELLLAESAPADRPRLARELGLAVPRDGVRTAGLYVAAEQGAVWAAGWGQLHQGSTGSVWRPRFLGADEAVVGAELTRRAAEWLASHELRVIQSLVAPHDANAAQWLEMCGFARIARLGYLVWDADHKTADEGPLRWQSVGVAGDGALAHVVERSYVGTLDSPALNGLRSVGEVLSGYREVGEYWPDAWLIALDRDEPAGCLILADHPPSNQCELVYMGLVPEVRGRGLGGQIIERAKQLVRLRGRDRLVLAVDLANAPALKQYQRHSFALWDERDVFVRAAGIGL